MIVSPRDCGIRERQGTTLLEVVIVVLILGVLATVASLAIPGATTPAQTLAATVGRARREAAEHGHTVKTTYRDSLHVIDIVAFVDGRVLIDSTGVVNPLTGRAEGNDP